MGREKLRSWCQQFYIPAFVAWTLFFCVGIVLQKTLEMSLGCLAAGLALCMLFGLIFSRKPTVADVFVYGAGLFCGALVLASSSYAPMNSVDRFIARSSQNVVLRGVVVSEPEKKGEETAFTFSVLELGRGACATRASGEVLVRMRAKAACAYGDELLLAGRLYRPPRFLKNEARIVLSVKERPCAVRHLGRRKGHFLIDLSLRLKRRLRDGVGAATPSVCAAVLNAMVLGDKAQVPKGLRDAMIRTGTWHVIVVSGTHTALVAMVVLMVLKVLRIPRRPRFCATIAVLILYGIITGGSPPVVRATIMGCVFLLSFMLERNPSFSNSLALAGGTILAFDPLALFNVGFQLSFVSVIFIVGLSPKFDRLLPEPWRKDPFLFWAAKSSSVSLAAWLGTIPLIAHTFGQFSPVTVAANMVVVPLASLVMTSGLALVSCGFLSQKLALVAAPAVEFFVLIFIRINMFFSRCPWAALRVPQVPWSTVAAYYIVLIVIVNALFSRRREPPDRDKRG